MGIVLMILFIAGIVYLLKFTTKKKKSTDIIVIKTIESVLNDEIDFYKKISTTEKQIEFKNRVIHFIETVKFTDIGKAKHTISDEVKIASSAIIPLYNFPNWEYRNIHEILLYEDHFDGEFNVDDDNHIMGMVGNGALNNTMALSLKALREGFENNDGNQTALHEFIHLIDKADGSVDGVPEYLIPKSMIAPWIRIIRSMIVEIRSNETQINPYAATNDAEFFAVI